MSEPRIVKKYPNRRLYDTVESRYITLEDLRRLIQNRIPFKVLDKRTQQDITQSVLLQTVALHEHGQLSALSCEFLAELIRASSPEHTAALAIYLEQCLALYLGGGTNGVLAEGAERLARQSHERWQAAAADIARLLEQQAPATG